MRLFTCPACTNLLYFENTKCEQCGHRLGYAPDRFAMLALEPDGELWTDPSGAWRFCANAGLDACNWLVEAAASDQYCRACRHNRTVPDLTVDENLVRWRALEFAKHRLFYSLMRFGLPLDTRAEDSAHGLAFDFLAETPSQPRVLTGHDDGQITIALREGDPAERERARLDMGELYRTPLGHFRHEIGHHYWDLLIRDTDLLDKFRALFGDERADYEAALQAHYAREDDVAWQDDFVSRYATSHPWEDFAESWAHYLHIVDALEMASSFGISIHPALSRDPALQADIGFDPYAQDDFSALIEAWLPLTFAMNSLNRSMGHADLYPFIISERVVEKLRFIHDAVRAEAR